MIVGFPDSEDPTSERALKRAAFFRAILGTDIDEFQNAPKPYNFGMSVSSDTGAVHWVCFIALW